MTSFVFTSECSTYCDPSQEKSLLVLQAWVLQLRRRERVLTDWLWIIPLNAVEKPNSRASRREVPEKAAEPVIAGQLADQNDDKVDVDTLDRVDRELLAIAARGGGISKQSTKRKLSNGPSQKQIRRKLIAAEKAASFQDKLEEKVQDAEKKFQMIQNRKVGLAMYSILRNY